MAKLQLNFVARANTGPLVTSLQQVRAAAQHSMAGVQTSAIRVEAPLNRLNKQIQTGRMNWRQLSQTMRNSSRIIAENNALLKAQAVSYIDAAGNARVYLNVVRGTAATQATLNQRLLLGVTAARAFGKQMVATGKNVQWAGRQVMVGLSLPLVMIASLATRGAEEFDKQMTRMVKVTNLSQVGMKNAMGDIVQTYEVGSKQMTLAIESIERQADRLAGIGASMGFMANETSKLAAEFSQMGYAGVQLDALTTSTLRLSRVSGAELSDAMNLTRLAAMAFGKQLGDGPGGLTETFARLNMIENRTSLSLNEMAGAIPIVAGVAKNLGIEIETLGGMLALMKDKGIDAREGATSLRTGLIRLVQDATDPAIEAFDKLNINITQLQELNRGNVFGLITELSGLLYDLQNSGDQAAEKTELFIAAIGKMVGTRAAARFTSMLEGIGRDVEMYTEVVNGFEVTQFRFVEGVDETSDAFRALQPALMDSNQAMKQFLFEEERVNSSLAGTAEILRAELNLELRRLGRRILPIKNALMEFARDVVRGFNNLSSTTRNIIGGFLLLVGVLGPVTMVLGVMLNAFGQVIQLFSRMLPALKLTTVALEAEKKAFSANTTAVVAGTSAKQAMIQTNSALTTSAAAVTSAVTAQATAYGALTAAMAGAAGRASAASQYGTQASGAFVMGRLARQTRTAKIDPNTGKSVPIVRQDPTSPTGFRTSYGQLAADPGVQKGKNAMGESIVPAAMMAAMTLPQIMAIPARKRFNPTAGMQMGHAEAIRQVLTRDVLMGQMKGADPEQLLAKSRGGMAPIDAIRYHAVREATAAFEREAARAAVSGKKAPELEKFLKGYFGRGAVESAVMRTATEGVQVVNPRTGMKTTQFAPQPMALREMTGMGQRLSDRTILNLTKEQRTMLQSRFGVQTGGRVELGRLERQVASTRGSTSAFQARNMIEGMVSSGEVRATHVPVTRQEMIDRDRAMARRETQAAVAQKRIPDTPQARAAYEREATPLRSREGVQGRAARGRESIRGGMSALMGRTPAQTAGQKGLAAGRNAALMAMLMPFQLIGKAVVVLTKTLFGTIPAIKLVGSIVLGSTVPAFQILTKLVTAGAAGMTALVAGFGKLTAGVLKAAAGYAISGGKRGMYALSQTGAGQFVTRGMRHLRHSGSGPLPAIPPAAAPGGFVPTPLTTGSLAKRSGSKAMGALKGAGSLLGSTLMGIGSMFVPKSVRAAAGRVQAARALPGGRQRSYRSMASQSFAQSGFGRGFRDARDAALLGQTLPPGVTMGRRGRQAAAAASKNAGAGKKGMAALKGLRGGLMGMGGMKGSIASFALGSVGGAAATVAIPIVLTMFGAAIANPAQFMDGLKGMMGPAIETLKKMWDGVVQTFSRLRETLSGGGGDADSFGGKMAKWAGVLTGMFGSALANAFTVVLGLVKGLGNLLNAVFQFLQGDGESAAESFKMAFLSVWAAIAEGFANLFDMMREIPVIGGMFGAVADRIRGWADNMNNTLQTMELIPNAVAEVNANLRETRKLMDENQVELEDMEKIIEDLAEFELVDPKEIDRLTEMVTVRADMSEQERQAREENVALVYDELVAMTHLTDEQITQIGQIIMRRRSQSQLAALEIELEELKLLLQEAENDNHLEIQSSMLAQLRLTRLRAQLEAELAKSTEDRNQELITSLTNEAAAIVNSNNERITTAGLQDEILAREEEIEGIREEIAQHDAEVNRQIANRKQYIQANSEATEEQAEEMERLADEAERAKEEVQQLRSAMGEVMGDITGVVDEIIRSQSDFIKQYFSDLQDGSEEYFNNFKEIFETQTEMMIEEIDKRAEYEIEMIDDITDAAIAKIEEEIQAEDELEKKRESFFRKEKARIDFLSARRTGEIKIQEEILRGNISAAAILQVEQRATSQGFFSDIVQERENELKEMRNAARQERMQDLDAERIAFIQQIEQEAEQMRQEVQMARQFNNEKAAMSSNNANQLIADAVRASDAAIAAEEQRIENYLREWQRVTPATEEEFLAHTQNLQNFMTESGIRLQEEINLINQNLRLALADIDAGFTESVNSQAFDLATMLENSRFTLQGIYESVAVTSENSLSAMLGMIDGFTNGLSGGFISGLELQQRFLQKFEMEMESGFDRAREIAIAVMADDAKWEAAGERAAAAFMRGIGDIESQIAAASRTPRPGAGVGSATGARNIPLGVAEDEWTHRYLPQSRFASADAEIAAAAAQAASEARVQSAGNISLPDHLTSGTNLSPYQRSQSMGYIDYGNWAMETPEAMRQRLREAERQRALRMEPGNMRGLPLDNVIEVHPDFAAMAQREFPNLNIQAAARGMLARDTNWVDDWLAPGIRNISNSISSFFGNIRERQSGYTSYHSGGSVESNLKSDEVPAILQTGEYVIQRSAVSSLGTKFLDSINRSSATFSSPVSRNVSLSTPPSSNESVQSTYNLNFNIEGGNIDESKLAQKVVFEIKKMERSSGGGRRVMS